MKKIILSITCLTALTGFAQTWTKISGIADTVKINNTTQINGQVLIVGQELNSVNYVHFTSPDGNTGWTKLPSFSFSGNYIYGFKQNNFLLGGGFLSAKKLANNAWTANFAGSGFAEFPDGTIIGGSGNYPDSIYKYSSAGVKGAKLGNFTFKFGPRFSIGNNNRLFLYSYGSGFAYIDQSDMSKINFPATLDGKPMTELLWQGRSIIDLVKTSNGTLIAVDNIAYGIIRSTDNGVTWTTVLVENSASGLRLGINSKDEIFVIYGGKVRKSIDLGLNYTDISGTLPAFRNELFVNAKNELFVICNANGSVNVNTSGIYKYDDGSTGNFTPENRSNTLFNIYPNPSTATFNLTVNEPFKDAEITITNTIGEKIQGFQLTNEQTKIDLSLMSKGIYIMRLVIDGKLHTNKLMLN